jgi:hypothetical protein
MRRGALPLFALLGRHLTDDEVREIADDLAASGDQHSAARSMPRSTR